MSKIKILFIITKSDTGGAQKYASDLAENLPSAEFDAKIIYGGRPVRDKNSLQAFAVSNGIKLKWLSNKVYPWLLFANDWLAVAEIIGILKREQPDIIHLNSSKAGIIGSIAAAIANLQLTTNNPSTKLRTGIQRMTKNGQQTIDSGRKIKVIFTAHGWVFNPTNELFTPLRWLYIALHKLAAYAQDAIICVSEYDYALALHLYIAPREKLHTIHNGISEKIKFLDRKTAREEIIKTIGIRDNESGINGLELKNKSPWIGSVGRLVKEKNYETFIRAAAQITEGLKNEKTAKPIFVLIGEGPELEKLKVKSRKLKIDDRFYFVPPTGNDAALLKAFDIFVMSSIKEGLPYILLEAMAAELPIVVTEAGGIPEIIKSHENGMMIAQKNPYQLAQAIQGLTANPQIASELKKTAKLAVHELFSLKKMVNKTETVYRSLKL